MIEYLSIIDYCNNQFQGRVGCQNCLYDNFCNNSDPYNCDKCYCCIKRIHDINNNTIHYQCEQMTYNYLIKHINRYASEVVWGLATFTNSFDGINACSIGCGPAPELYAIKAYYRKEGLNDDRIRFKGFDTQQINIWNPIWNATQHIFGDTVSFFNQDAFTYYLENDEQVNLVVLNYMVSDMIKFDKIGFPAFLERFKEFLGRQREVMVVLNDVFLIDVYNVFNHICNTFQYSNKFVVEECRRQYFAEMKHGFVFGNKLQKNNLLFANSPLELNFNHFSECKSIQLILKIKQR